MATLSGVLVVGDVINDVIVLPAGPTALDTDTAAEIRSTPGGSGANQAAWLGALGIRVRLAARVGEADAGRQRRQLAAAGVDPRLSVDPERPTGSIVVLVGEGGARSMYTDRGASAHLEHLPPGELLASVGHLHVSGYALIETASRAAVSELWQAAAEAGLTRSVDVGSSAFLRQIGPGFVGLTDGADVVFANLAEGRLVTGLDDDAPGDDVVARLLDHYPFVVLKLGPRGAIVANRSETVTGSPAPGVVVDPTGAGDAFCAGFLARWLQGDGLTEAAASGSAAALRAIKIVGGRPPSDPAPTDRGATDGPPWERLREAARAASDTAFAPYSRLRVGAAGIRTDGQIVTGCNVENASFGLTLCAECGLVSALRAAGGDRLVALSVVAQDGRPLTPCGRCRQVLLDNGGPALLIDRGPGTDAIRLGELLPGAFGADDLPRENAP